MVTNLREGNKNKCEQYWPESGSGTFGPFMVTLTEYQVFSDYCTRTMQVAVSSTVFTLTLASYYNFVCSLKAELQGSP